MPTSPSNAQVARIVCFGALLGASLFAGVIPGMIDNHFDDQLVGGRPGWETREIEAAFSIADALAVIREQAKGVLTIVGARLVHGG